MHARLRHVAIAAVISLVGGLSLGTTMPPAGASSGFTPYFSPSFRCPTVHRYGNGKAPSLELAQGFTGTLCVVYDKRDITADNGGAIRFSLAEPARFAVAGKCRYWQRDHWKIRLDRGFGKIVEWDGSYWWDLHDGDGAAILRHFRIAGTPTGPTQAADAVATVNPRLAAAIRRYGAGPGGGFGAGTAFPPDPGC